jgi:hypothetical protein
MHIEIKIKLTDGFYKSVEVEEESAYPDNAIDESTVEQLAAKIARQAVAGWLKG